MDLIYHAANFLQGLTLRAFADWRVSGREHVLPMGPLIIVANHQSNVDPTLLSTSIPRRITFLADKGIFRGPAASWFFRAYGAFPLDRERIDIGACRWLLGQLGRGQAVVVFPEGTRAAGGMRKARSGVARLALMSQAPLLPVGITGTERLGSWLRVFNPTGEIRVNIGTAFSVPSIDGRPSKAVLDSLTDMIMQRVAVLLPDRYQGVYGIKGPEATGAKARVGLGVETGGSPRT
jgi:1-acyl-sn-glycerol-3-phosphate acyltransferase